MYERRAFLLHLEDVGEICQVFDLSQKFCLSFQNHHQPLIVSIARGKREFLNSKWTKQTNKQTKIESQLATQLVRIRRILYREDFWDEIGDKLDCHSSSHLISSMDWYFYNNVEFYSHRHSIIIDATQMTLVEGSGYLSLPIQLCSINQPNSINLSFLPILVLSSSLLLTSHLTASIQSSNNQRCLLHNPHLVKASSESAA